MWRVAMKLTQIRELFVLLLALSIIAGFSVNWVQTF
jgi:hypothetical protein